MTILRRIFTGASLVIVACGLASADTLISFTVTIPATQTDLANVNKLVTSWDPGGTGTYNTIASDTTSAYSGQTGFQSGITMASLNAANTTYTLNSYDIYVKSTLNGTFSATATTNNTYGSVGVDSYAALSLGSPMATLSISSEPTNDLFAGGNSTPPGYGPDPTVNKVSFGPLNSGQSTGLITIGGGGKSQASDLGYALANSGVGVGYTPITTSLGTVSGSSPLSFYASTLTSTDTTLTGGGFTTTQNTNVAETITVVYDYTSTYSAAPEPATMAMMGGALIALSLIGKRFRTAKKS